MTGTMIITKINTFTLVKVDLGGVGCCTVESHESNSIFLLFFENFKNSSVDSLLIVH